MAPIASSDRLRFSGFSLERLPNGQCTARVTLTWRDDPPMTGEAQGLTSQSGELRCAALACVQALSQAVRDMSFELLGVKALRAFDATVVIVSLAASGGEGKGPRIVGSYLAEDDVPRGAALAVLNATNRILLGRLRRRQD